MQVTGKATLALDTFLAYLGHVDNHSSMEDATAPQTGITDVLGACLERSASVDADSIDFEAAKFSK